MTYTTKKIQYLVEMTTAAHNNKKINFYACTKMSCDSYWGQGKKSKGKRRGHEISISLGAWGGCLPARGHDIFLGEGGGLRI